ncbi:PAS domain S-box protein [Mariprofundus aestuarium]|nr:PAS domain S-box protein [Mariprofundus aestuarium]
MSPIGMALCGTDRVPVYINNEFTRILGYSPEELKNMCCTELTPAEYVSQEIQLFEQLATDKTLGPYDKEYIKKDGSRINVRIKGISVELDGEQYIWSSVVEIEDLKNAEKATRISEERFALAMEGANDGLWDWDLKTDEVYYSPRWKEILGYQEDELEPTFSTGIDFVHPDDRATVIDKVEQYISGTTDSYNMEFRMRHKLGHWVDILSKATLVADKVSNKPIRLVGTHQDITEKKQAEKCLYEANERHRDLAESMSDWIWEVNADGVYTYCSAKVSSILGYQQDEIIGKRPFDFMLPDEAGRVGTIFSEIVQAQRPFRNLENWNLTKEGQLICLLTSGVPIIGGDGELLGYRGVDADITDQKKAEEELRKQSQAIKYGGEGVMITGTDGSIEYINPAFTEITGYLPDEILGKNPRILKSSAQDPSYYKALWDTISSGSVWRGTLIDKRKDGSFYPAMMTVSPIKDLNEKTTHYVSTHRDMTEHQQLEEQARQSQKLESIGTLVGGIAHDFNNMLAAIEGSLYLARTQLDDHVYVENILNDINKLTSRSADMVKQLLTYARKGKVSMRPLILNALMEDAFKLANKMIPENIEHICDTCNEHLIINADATQIQQVLMNLAANALHAVAGVENPKITCGTSYFKANENFMQKHSHSQSGEFARISVRDNGCGIKKDHMDKITEPFFTTKGVGEGTGLGLSMVYGVVKMHNGTLEVESEKGKGTVFHIYIPLSKSLEMRESETSEANVPIAGNKETILLVDDENDLLITSAQVLESLNYRVLQATNGEEALQIFEDEQDSISLVFTDIIMPKISGFDLMEQIWLKSKNTPALFASGYDAMGHEIPKEKEQQAIIISKPYSPLEVSFHIRDLLN